jgi:hypothetical protein
MALTWTQRREELLSDCIVSPDVFNPMIDRLAAFVVPYQPETSPQFHKNLNSCKNPCGAEGETHIAGESVCRKDAASKPGSLDERNSKGSWTRSSAASSMHNAWPR